MNDDTSTYPLEECEHHVFIRRLDIGPHLCRFERLGGRQQRHESRHGRIGARVHVGEQRTAVQLQYSTGQGRDIVGVKVAA